MSLPKDPVILLSYVNTQLRDHYATLDELAKVAMVDKKTIEDKLAMINYVYDMEKNQFV